MSYSTAPQLGWTAKFGAVKILCMTVSISNSAPLKKKHKKQD